MEKEKKIWKILLIAAAAVAVAAAAAAVVIWNLNVFTLELTMAGDPAITLEYGSDYAEAGVSAEFSGTILNKEVQSVEVTTEGTVDTTVVGTYTITYTASRMGLTQACTRTVHVVDTQKPTITLTVDPDTFTLPGQTYEEEGFAAWDDYDGDLTQQVVRTVSEAEIL